MNVCIPQANMLRKGYVGTSAIPDRDNTGNLRKCDVQKGKKLEKGNRESSTNTLSASPPLR